MAKKPFSIYQRATILWLFLIILFFVVFLWQFKLPFPLLAIASLNSATFMLYGVDKMLAIQKENRIPEYVLYLAAFAGGAGGALLSMYLFHHKTSKTSFQFGLALVILVEIIVIGYFYK
jgi:uncharacterized membrane protein YsdA (DUF1294 family)